jgi:anti-sigma factor RsiW
VTCREFIDQLLDYSAGDLTEWHRAVADRHLAACADCRGYVSQYRGSVTLLRQAMADDEADARNAAVPATLISSILNGCCG